MNVSEKAAQFFQMKPGWVFNPWLDFIAFYIPLLTAVFFKLPSALDIYFLKITFDIGHLFVTLIPLYFISKTRAVDMKPLILVPALVLAAAQIVCYFYFDLFTYIFGYYALFHICTQLYGWLARIQRNSHQPVNRFEHLFERLLLTTMLLSSVLFWHTSYSTMAKTWFYHNNLVFDIPRLAWQIVDFAFLSLLVIWICLLLFHFFVKKHIPVGKILLLTAIWLMFYYSLVFNFSGQYGINFFWYVIVLNHGISYIIFVFTQRQPSTKQKIIPYFVLYVAGILIIGVCWQKFSKYASTLDIRYAAALVWGPLILHYAVDSRIWKKSFSERLTAGVNKPQPPQRRLG